MKTMKSILIAATVIAATAVSTLSAQQAADQQHTWKVAKGDSVMIKRECQQYLTGEKPSVWVWDKVHTVYQLGTKRFPEGVLLMNIYSWICEDCLVVVNGQAQTEAEKAAEEQAEEKKAYEEKKQEPAPAAKEEEPAPVVKEEEPAPVVVPVVVATEEEPAPAVKEEEPAPAVKEEKPAPVAKEEEPAPVAKEEEPAPVVKEEEPAPVAKEEPVEETVIREAAKGDTIRSQQKFRHSYDRFTIGLRGGAASLLHHADNGKWGCGADVVLDLQYAHYWAKDGRPVDLGIITGLGIGYSQSSLKANVNDVKKYGDAEAINPKDSIQYTVRADEVKEHDGQLQLEIPLMFSLIHERGLYFNIGPKFMIPVYTPYKQTISNNSNTFIQAYFEETGVLVKNEVITGVLSDQDYTKKGSDYKNNFTINVMLMAEIGYEWVLKSGNSLALGAYADYSIYNSFKNATSSEPLVTVQPPKGLADAVVTVNPATKTYADKLGFFDAGIKVAYHFNFPKKMQYRPAQL